VQWLFPVSRVPRALGRAAPAMFGSCCCADNSDLNQIINHSTTNENEATLVDRAAGVLVQQDAVSQPVAAAAEVNEGTAAAAALGDPFSARSLSPEEKEAEKARLQQLVNNFAKKAVRGCPCVYIKESTGERVTTQYRIDKSLEYLIVVSNQDTSRAEVTCPIASIQDIYSLVEDGEGCFPAEVVSKLSAEDQKMLLMVVYRNGQSKMFRFCLLEESPDTRDTFLECLRILCIYAQSAPQSSGAPPAAAS